VYLFVLFLHLQVRQNQEILMNNKLLAFKLDLIGPLLHLRHLNVEFDFIKSSVFGDISLCIPLHVNLRFGGIYHLHPQCRTISQVKNQYEAGSKLCLSFDPEDGKYSSETSPDFQQTTWRYIPEDRTLHKHHCKNLKSYINFINFRKKRDYMFAA
jgi:hypothetical protein